VNKESAWPENCRYLEGRSQADIVLKDISAKVHQLKVDGIEPALAFVLMGDDPVDQKQVELKIRVAEEAGFSTVLHNLPGMAAQRTVNNLLDELSADNRVHAVFGQLPFTRHISREDAGRHLEAIKDIDLLSPAELGKFYLGRSMYRPAVVEAVVELLGHYEIPVKGADITILGLGEIMSRPLSVALTDLQATVTVCHLASQNLEDKTASAEILITTIGKARFVKWGMVGDGAIVIDLGQSAIGGRVVGDVDERAVPRRAAGLTPVPGGIGPLIIASILQNGLAAVESAAGAAK